MAVILTDRPLGVRRRTAPEPDAHGDRRAVEAWGPLAGPWPGRAVGEGDVPVGQSGAAAWSLALDPAAWPVEPGDLVVEPGAREWLVTSARLIRNNAASDVDYVQVSASLRENGDAWP